MTTQICETCKKKGARCYCAPNSTCEGYEYDDNWIKIYEQVPPLNEEVELKVIVDGQERIYINKLIPMLSGIYKWCYCDYDGDEVIGWRRMTWLESEVEV